MNNERLLEEFTALVEIVIKLKRDVKSLNTELQEHKKDEYAHKI